MSNFRVDLMARAAVTRVANGEPRTIADIPDAMGSYGEQMTKKELVQVIGYLSRWVLVEELKR